MHVDLVVFDMAGTTVHDRAEVAESLQGALLAAGVEVTLAQVNEVMGLPKPDAIRRLLEGRALEQPPDVDAIHRDFVARMIAHYRTDPWVREVAGASAVLRWLRDRQVKVALDTGFSWPIAEAIVERLGFAPLVDAIVTSDMARGRPHPDMIFTAMKKTAVSDPLRVVKVGDTPADLAEGRAAGCGLVIGVTRGSHSLAELARHDHDLLIPTVASLPGVFLSRASRFPKKLVA